MLNEGNSNNNKQDVFLNPNSVQELASEFLFVFQIRFKIQNACK
jgi:hypothetical protein